MKHRLFTLFVLFTLMLAFLPAQSVQAETPASPLYASGDFLWAKSMGGTDYDSGYSIAVDSNGNVYTTGYFSGTADFDPGAGTFNLTSAGDNEIFVSKVDSNGNFVWAKRIGGTDNDYGRGITVDSNGNVYTTGYFEGTADFDPGTGTFNLTSAGDYDIFISKLDSSGNFVWAKSMGGTDDDHGYGIAVDSGNVYTTGYFAGTADFDPGAGAFNLTSAGTSDIFVSKLDSGGNFVWAKSMGGTDGDGGYSIAVDSNGNVYTTGGFRGTADFDPGAGTFNLTSAGGDEIFVSKLDSGGNFVWAKSMGGMSNDSGRGIAVDSSGNIHTTGSFSGTADFDPGAGTFNLTSAGISDIFVSKLDNSGNFVWAKSMGGTGNDGGNSIAVNSSGNNVYTIGNFELTADFDPGAGTYNLTSAGINDIFVSKLDGSGNFVWAKSMGGTNWDTGVGIAVDSSGYVYTTGYFWGTVDFDPGAGTFNLTSAGTSDIFVSKLDKPGPATITVNTTADNTTTDGFCTLREAITNADNNAATYADCVAGGENDTILFDNSLGTATITLASTLPAITDTAGLTIDGEDVQIAISGNDSVGVFHVNAGALLTLQAISVTHGSAAQGGGLENYGTATIAYSTFSNNAASTFGGGIYNSGTLTITHSTFSDNSAYNYGGGVYNTGTLTIANSTLFGNSAYWGGGLMNSGATATILNSTFSGNSATAYGGGVATANTGTLHTTTIRNTILANSVSGGDCGNNISGTLIGDHNLIESTTTCTSIATLTSDPNLGALTGSPAYFPLNSGSPAIDAGDDAICAAAPVNNQSQNGRTRPQGAHCDIGSYEANATLTFQSAGAQDGWVLESGENTNVGGTLDSAATTFRLGDDNAKKQYRGILSFSTGAGLPDTAVIAKVTLKVKKQGITGEGNPVTMFQGFMVDIKKGYFGTTALQTSDFQTAASKSYGPFLTALSGGWYKIDLTPGKGYINKLSSLSGLTQIRLRFKLDDNNNATANYLSLYSGNAPAASRPQLIIEYYIP